MPEVPNVRPAQKAVDAHPNAEVQAVSAADVPPEVAAQAEGNDPSAAPDFKKVIQTVAYTRYRPSKTTLAGRSENPEPMEPGSIVKHGPAPGDIVVWVAALAWIAHASLPI